MDTTKSSPNAILNNIRVASPCGESWEAMPGGDRVRSCDRCRHKVYNLSEMTADEAAKLLTEAEGRVCVRFYRRADGTVLTREDCPVGVRAVRKRIARGTAVGFTSLAVACGVGFAGRPRSEQPRFVQWVLNKVAPETQRTMGEVAVRPAIELPMAPATPPSNFDIPAGHGTTEPGTATMGTPLPPPSRAEMGEAQVVTPEPVEKVMGKPAIHAAPR